MYISVLNIVGIVISQLIFFKQLILLSKCRKTLNSVVNFSTYNYKFNPSVKIELNVFISLHTKMRGTIMHSNN